MSPRLYPSPFERKVMPWVVAGAAMVLLIYGAATTNWKSRPAPQPVKAAVADTVWLGVTYLETMDGKMIVKYERVENPVLWDSARRVPGKGE